MIKRHIPNAITSMNLLCGTLGVICAIRGILDGAFLLMLAGAVFDFCDGLAARLLHAYSNIGKELDSLADMVSFGVLPALMMYSAVAESIPYRELTSAHSPLAYGAFIPLLIAVFSGLRLAKFNVDTRQGHSFIGLPTPACAMICASAACLVTNTEVPKAVFFWVMPALSLLLCFLLVSEIPFFSFKMGGGGKTAPRETIQRAALIVIAALSTLFCLLTHTSWTAAVLGTFTGYVAINLICLLFPFQDGHSRT